MQMRPLSSILSGDSSEACLIRPRNWDLSMRRKEVGVHDITKEKMIEAIKNEKDPERKEELIRAAELFARII